MRYNVLSYLEDANLSNPQKIALSDGINIVTYSTCIDKAMRIGSFLIKEFNHIRNKPIAVLIDRNINTVLAFLGIVYSGNFYVPVDPSMPEERINRIFNTVSPVAIIDARQDMPFFKNTYRLTDILQRKINIDNQALKSIRNTMIDTDPLYAMFTSGSTGDPKGVIVSHRSVIDLVEAFHEVFGFNEELIFGNQAPFDFDVSVKDIYNTLRCGATMEILPKKLFRMPKLLIDYLNEKKVNTLIWAVSALRIVSDFKTLDAAASPPLKYIMFSGEVMPVRALNYWMDHVPSARYINLYGPTEITCNCSYHEITKKYGEDQALPIGKPFPNTRIQLRAENNSIITEPNQVGEICVSGTCLALGYWNNPTKTQEAFIQNPIITAYESKIYATGDLGFYNEDGDLVFASRKDFQIKHMGHRIELGEIEVALNSISFIDVACCLYDKEAERILCFYQAPKECKSEIISALSKKLPKYMWPNKYVHYEELPLNKNGKIDRVLLKETFQ